MRKGTTAVHQIKQDFTEIFLNAAMFAILGIVEEPVLLRSQSFITRSSIIIKLKT